MNNKLLNSLCLRFCILLICCNVVPHNCSPQHNRNRRNVGRQPCSKFRFEGYFCTPIENCGYDGYTIDDSLNSDELRTGITDLLSGNTFNSDFDADEYGCDSPLDICCRNSSFYGKPEPIIRDLVEVKYPCEDYAFFGYDCVDEDECADDGYTIDDSVSGGLGVRSTGSYASRLSCDCSSSLRQGLFSSTVCCRKFSFFGKPEPPGKKFLKTFFELFS